MTLYLGDHNQLSSPLLAERTHYQCRNEPLRCENGNRSTSWQSFEPLRTLSVKLHQTQMLRFAFRSLPEGRSCIPVHCAPDTSHNWLYLTDHRFPFLHSK